MPEAAPGGDTPRPTLSFIIPVLQEERYIEATLKRLRELTSMPYEIIVSDGGSTDKTVEIARGGADVIVTHDDSPRQTIAAGKNAGAAAAQGEFLVFLDADVRIVNPSAFFETLVGAFRKNQYLVGASVRLLPYPESGTFADYLGCFILNFWYLIWNNLLGLSNASGEFQMIRARAFQTVGGYNERLVAGEDNEMFARLGSYGRTKLFWSPPVYHSCRRPHKIGWLRLYGIWIKNGLYIFILHRSAYKEWEVLR